MNLQEIYQYLAQLDTACLCDANKAIRVLDSDIRPIRRDLKLIGKAHTLTANDDFLTVIQALKESQPKDVLIVDGQQGKRALLGEIFATEAARKGLAGLVVDGAVRDSQTLQSIDLPVYSRSICPNAGTTKKVFETQIPIICGGVTVNPGDIVFGDQDGILVASEVELAELIPIAQEIQSKETKILIELNKGTPLLDMLNFEEHFEKTKSHQESHLKFKI